MESCHETRRLAGIDATLLSTCQSLRAIHTRSHPAYSPVTHEARIEISLTTKLCRTYLLCGYEASSLTQGLIEKNLTCSIGGGAPPPNTSCRPSIPPLHSRVCVL